MKLALLSIGLLMTLIMAGTIYGAIMVTDVGKSGVNQQDASAVFIVLLGMTFVSFLLWAIVAKLVQPPISALAV